MACLNLSRAEDRPALLQTLLRHAAIRYKGDVENIESIYTQIRIAIDDQFIKYIDKENLNGLYFGRYMQ